MTAEQPQTAWEGAPSKIAERAKPTLLRGDTKDRSRDVLVMMPFRSEDLFDRRVQMLEYHRLRHVIERRVSVKIKRALHGPDCAEDAAPHGFKYKTRVLRQYAGYFPEQALMEIAEADVLIGMLTHANTNVTFELAVRHVLRDGLILLADEALGPLPIYLAGMVSIDYKAYRAHDVDKVIRHLAADDSRVVDFDEAMCEPKLLAELEEVINRSEGELVRALQHALERIEHGAFLRPPYFRTLARYMSPRALMESWESHDPLCVIQVDWKKRSCPGFYDLATDLEDGPWVCAGNAAFQELYALQGIPDPNVAERPLGGEHLIQRLQSLQVIDPPDLEAFVKDQVAIGPTVFLEGRNVTAGVPLSINGRHEPRYRNRRFLPSVVSRATVGPETGSHRTYLVVAYVPLNEQTPQAIGMSRNGTSIWRDLHALQTTLCWSQELPFYYASSTWLRAQSVLDVGTGHGDYVRALAERFPDKRYVGIDVAPAYVEAAAHESRMPNVRFECGDVMELGGQHDFVLARLLLQHLQDVPGAVAKMIDAVAPGGSLLLIDALDELRAFYPPLTEFPRFFERYAARERENGRDRNVLSRIPQIIAGIPGVSIAQAKDVLIPSSMPGHLAVFRAVYSRVIDLLEPDLASECDVAAVRREWGNWCNDDRAYAQVGIRMIRIDKA